jgi:hypothetical protein
VSPNFFKDLRGAANQKRLKNTVANYLVVVDGKADFLFIIKEVTVKAA